MGAYETYLSQLSANAQQPKEDISRIVIALVLGALSAGLCWIPVTLLCSAPSIIMGALAVKFAAKAKLRLKKRHVYLAIIAKIAGIVGIVVSSAITIMWIVVLIKSMSEPPQYLKNW